MQNTLMIPQEGFPFPLLDSSNEEGHSTATIMANLAKFAFDARGAFSPNTERAFRSDIKIFTTWCADNMLPCLPAAPETVGRFIDAMSEHHATATVRRYVSNISVLHKSADVANPTLSMTVKLALKRMAREKGSLQKQAVPLNRSLINKMVSKEKNTLWQIRDMAIVTLAYDTLCRRSEIASLDFSDVTINEEDGDGTLLVRKSKSDQEGHGSIRYIAPDTVGFLQAWLEKADITSGPLFRSINQAGQISGSICDQTISYAMKRMAGLVAGKKQPLAVSGHSCRVGAAQDMVSKGLSIAEIMQAGGWQSPTMVARYSERLAVRRGAAAKLAHLQARDQSRD